MPQKRIYLDNLPAILATTGSRDSFITWAKTKGFSTFLYYDLRTVLSPTSSWAVGNTANAQTLGNFIAQARVSGITSHVAVVSETKAFATGSTNTYSYWETEDYLGRYSLPFGGNSTGRGGHKLINNYNDYMLSLSSANTNKIFKSTQGTNGTTDFSGINLELEYWWDHTLNGKDATIRTTLGNQTVTLLNTTTTTLGLTVGMKVWSTALQTDTVISSIVNTTTITVSKTATVTSPTTGVASKFGGNVYPNGVTNYGYQVWQRTNSLDQESIANLDVWWKVCDLHKTWAVTGNNGKNSAYCGWWLPAGTELTQCGKIVRYMDSLDLHVYRAPTSNAQVLTGTAGYGQRMFDFVKTRLSFLGQAQLSYNPSAQFKVHFIYSMEGDFSGPWMSANPTVTFDALHNAVVTAFNSSTFTGKSGLIIDGYTIFKQSLARTIRP